MREGKEIMIPTLHLHIHRVCVCALVGTYARAHALYEYAHMHAFTLATPYTSSQYNSACVSERERES